MTNDLSLFPKKIAKKCQFVPLGGANSANSAGGVKFINSKDSFPKKKYLSYLELHLRNLQKNLKIEEMEPGLFKNTGCATDCIS